MKRLILFLLTVIMTAGVMAQTHKVAILETVDRENILSYGIKLMVRSHLAEAVTNTAGYEAYDRTNLQQIFDEQEFQRTGYVSDEDIKKIGEMTGVQYVLVAEASKLDEKNLFITAKILNVESARVEKTANTMAQTDIPSLQKCAQDLASRLLADIKVEEFLEPISSIEGDYIQRLSDNEYIIGGKYVKRSEYCKFIKSKCVECVPAYQQFQKGTKLAYSGWGILALGCACIIGGGIIYATGIDLKEYENNFGEALQYHDEASSACVSLFTIGSALCATSVPLLAVGYSKRNTAYKAYNEYCAPKKAGIPITLNLQSGRDGLGLALCF